MNTSKLAAHVEEAEVSAPPEVSALHRRVEKLLEERKLTIKWLYEAVGMSKAGWSQMWASGSTKLTVVYRIADALDMDVTTLLSGELSNMAMEPAATYTARPRYLEERVADLERELQQLKKSITRK